MANKAKPLAGSKPARSGPKASRVSKSGKFVVARQATKSDRFSEAELKRAVRKVVASKGAPRT